MLRWLVGTWMSSCTILDESIQRGVAPLLVAPKFLSPPPRATHRRPEQLLLDAVETRTEGTGHAELDLNTKLVARAKVAPKKGEVREGQLSRQVILARMATATGRAPRRPVCALAVAVLLPGPSVRAVDGSLG